MGDLAATKPRAKRRPPRRKAPKPVADATSEPAADAPVQAAGGKAIVLFSDGTGNSSAKLFKTNVWRMYESIELGETDIDPEQVVYYDEGVGNSGFRPLAILGGVFGWGLKRNVLDLYSFLCRNFADGDRIYAFGFSRGAFTIRVLVGLIASQGLIRYQNEADLAHQAADAYRAYVRRAPRFPPMRFLLPLWRYLVGLLILGKRILLRQRRYDQNDNLRPRIRFVGLWDTVAAYGGPILELVRAFDDWIRPLSFKDQSLPPEVDRGRHALALDDERDAFQPVPWDEPRTVDRERIRQVWFAGAHADVGGGYPDDSLAYVSLAWMMEEAEAAGLKIRPEKVADAHRIANAFGPMHDPRAGLGSYYRYQPRLVGAYVEPPEPGTESIENPDHEGEGMDQCAWVHESVVFRIEAGTDGYAPITLPRHFRVVRHDPKDARFPAKLRKNLSDTANERTDRLESYRDMVWIRRILYFATVAASLALAALPLWLPLWPDPFCGDSRCVVGGVFGLLSYLLPGFADPWVVAFSAAPTWTAIFLGLIFLFISLSQGAERRMRDNARMLWAQTLAGRVTLPSRRGAIRAMRTNKAYQAVLEFIKWHALPFIFGLVMLALLFWTALVAAAQVRLLVGEGHNLFCGRAQTSSDGYNFTTSNPCNETGVSVREGERYEIVFHVPEKWQDGANTANETWPEGIPAAKLSPPIGHVFALFRRVVSAGYLQPVAAVETGRRGFPAVNMQTLDVVRRQDGVYAAEFTAAADGRLVLFANDAVPPWPWPARYFYDGSDESLNRGRACVAISRHEGDDLVPVVTCDTTCTTPGGACVARRNAKIERGRRAEDLRQQ